MEHDKILAPQPALNTKANTLPLQPGSPPPTVSYPFQLTLASLGTADTSDSVSVSANSSLASYTSLYRHASLRHLKATIHPTHTAPAYPTSVSLVWVPANSTATASDILNVYGGQCFCVGGSVNSIRPIDIEANLSNLNPALKASTTFTDTPKLLYASSAQATPPTSATCYLTISGMVELSSPLLQASS